MPCREERCRPPNSEWYVLCTLFLLPGFYNFLGRVAARNSNAIHFILPIPNGVEEHSKFQSASISSPAENMLKTQNINTGHLPKLGVLPPPQTATSLSKLQFKSAHLTPQHLRSCTSFLKLVANTKEKLPFCRSRSPHSIRITLQKQLSKWSSFDF